MCRSRTVYWKGSACRTYPSSFTPFVVIIWIALGCGDCELEMGGRSGDHLSPSILGTVLPQWAELIGMQRGLSLSLPPAFLPESLSLCSVWNRHSDEKQNVFEGRAHAGAHAHTHREHMTCFPRIAYTNVRSVELQAIPRSQYCSPVQYLL